VERRLEEALQAQRKDLEETAVEGITAALERQREKLQGEADGRIAEFQAEADRRIADLEAETERRIAADRRQAEAYAAAGVERRLAEQRQELEAEAEERVAEARREIERRGAAQAEQQLEESLETQEHELQVDAEGRVAAARREAEAQVAEARRHAEASAAAEIARLNAELKLMEAERQEALAHQERLRAAVGEAEQSAATLVKPSAVVGDVELRSAKVNDLEGLGLSTTQARRVIRYRDKKGIDSIDRLHEVPGLPDDLLAELRRGIRN
jgi:hypothetical protein